VYVFGRGGAYQSRRTRNLFFVHVVDFATAASIAGRPLAARSDTASAAHSTESNARDAKRAYSALSEKWTAMVDTC
jgi:hypothetical protein